MVNSHFAIWHEALSLKYLPSETQSVPRWTRPDFDKPLASYDAVSDFPTCMFAEDLIAAYPSAKIILTTRTSAEEWQRSMVNTIWGAYSWRSSHLLRYIDPWFGNRRCSC